MLPPGPVAQSAVISGSMSTGGVLAMGCITMTVVGTGAPVA